MSGGGGGDEGNGGGSVNKGVCVGEEESFPTKHNGYGGENDIHH